MVFFPGSSNPYYWLVISSLFIGYSHSYIGFSIVICVCRMEWHNNNIILSLFSAKCVKKQFLGSFCEFIDQTKLLWIWYAINNTILSFFSAKCVNFAGICYAAISKMLLYLTICIEYWIMNVLYRFTMNSNWNEYWQIMQ